MDAPELPSNQPRGAEVTPCGGQIETHPSHCLVCLSVGLSACLSVCLSVGLSASLSVALFVYVSSL